MSLASLQKRIVPILTVYALAMFSVAGGNLLLLLVLGPAAIAGWLISERLGRSPPAYVTLVMQVAAIAWSVGRISGGWSGGPSVFVTSFAEFIALLLTIRMVDHGSPRELAQILVLNALLIVAAVLTDVGLFVAIMLVPAVPLVLAAALLQQVAVAQHRRRFVISRHAQRAGHEPAQVPDASTDRGDRPLRIAAGFVGTCTVGAAVVAAVVFVVMPRSLGIGAEGAWGAGGEPVVGFTSRIDLGASSGRLSLSSEVVAEARVYDSSGNPLRGDLVLYLRGAVLDRYANGRWEHSVGTDEDGQNRELVLEVPEGGAVEFGVPNRVRDEMTLEVVLRTSDTDNWLLTAWEPRAMILDARGAVRIDQRTKTVRWNSDTRRLAYALRYANPSLTPRPLRPEVPLDVSPEVSPHDVAAPDLAPDRARPAGDPELEAMRHPDARGPRDSAGSGPAFLTVAEISQDGEGRRRRRPRPVGDQDADPVARALATDWPPMDPASVSPEIRELLERTILPRRNLTPADVEPTAYPLVNAIETYLRDNYGYTLDLDLTGVPGRYRAIRDDEDPVEYFLFVRREGHCEYFASAMAMLCRAAGLRSRVVTGFVAAEFNHITNYYVVRASNAHAWVEVEVSPGIWRAFDPTPPADFDQLHRPPPGLFGAVRRWLDAVEHAYVRGVVAFDDEERRSMFGLSDGETFEGQLDDLLKRFVDGSEDRADRPAAFRRLLLRFAVAFAVLLVASTILIVTIRLLPGGRRFLSRIVLFLRSLLARLAGRARVDDPWGDRALHAELTEALRKAGLHKPLWVPLRVWLRALEQQTPAAASRAGPAPLEPALRVAELIYLARFARRPITPEARASASADLDRLREAVRVGVR